MSEACAMVALGMGEAKEGGRERGRGREAICAEHPRGACFGAKKEKRLVSLAAPALSLRGANSLRSRGVSPLFWVVCQPTYMFVCTLSKAASMRSLCF